MDHPTSPSDAAAILQLRRRGDLKPAMAGLVKVVGVVAVVATVGMAVHLLAALGPASIADGQPSLIYEVQKWNEIILSTLWGLGIIALAVAGGLTGTLGSRITIPLGVVGGVACVWLRRRSRSPTGSTPCSRSPAR